MDHLQPPLGVGSRGGRGEAAGSGNRMLKCNFVSDLSTKMCLLDLHFVACIYTDDPVETWCIVPHEELLWADSE